MGGIGSGGHNRIPVELHVLKGTYRRCRHGALPSDEEPAKQNLLPPAPGSLTPAAADVYECLRTALSGRTCGHPEVADATTFAMLWTAGADADADGNLPLGDWLKDHWSRIAHRWDVGEREHDQFVATATDAYRAATWPDE